MSMVCGLDLHRQQITFDAMDTVSGEVWQGRVWQPDRERVRRWLTRDVAGRADGQPVVMAVEGCTGWRDVIGPDHHPTLPQILRPGLLMVVSPIEMTVDGARVGVELVYPAGQGFVLVVALTDVTQRGFVHRGLLRRRQHTDTRRPRRGSCRRDGSRRRRRGT